ncbi:bromodomain and PHD finger-containing protein 1 [Nematocida sp. AWRm77]|nr:bromodomain and PHD finger-containing protein 1 [Nematocida sp. AWRm77]
MKSAGTCRALKRRVFDLLERAKELSAWDVEYNMDSTDAEILQLLLKKHPWATEEDYELVVDRLEKEYHFLQRIAATKIQEKESPPEECNVCGEQETSNENFLVLCDGCNIAVHQTCYGIPNIPEGNWLCRRCLLAPRKKISCVLCCAPGGAFKKTSSGGWCHVLCGMLIPGARFENFSFMEPIDTEDTVRNSTTCLLCGSKRGGVAQCAYSGCRKNFHCTCAAQKDYYLDLGNAVMYCAEHDPRKRIGDVSFFSDMPDVRYPSLEHAPTIRKNVDLWMPQRRVQSSIQNISPKILHYTVNRIVYRDLQGRPGGSAFVKDMYSVWKTRRRGESILKRLRIDTQPEGFGGWGEFTPCPNLEEESFSVLQGFHLPPDVFFPFKETLQYHILVLAAHKVSECMRTVRQMRAEVEKDVYLAEYKQNAVISKRIKEYPEMLLFLEKLKQADAHELFKEPVTEDIAPNYSSFVSSPQCLDVIEQRIKRLEYPSLEALCKDVKVLIKNAYAYNGEDSLIGKEAARLEKIYKQWSVLPHTFIIARAPPFPYLPYRVCSKAEETPKDCINIENIWDRSMHMIERAHIYSLPPTCAQTQALLQELNKATGITIEYYQIQNDLIQKIFKKNRLSRKHTSI